MIGLAKDGSLAARRAALGYVYDKSLVHALFEQVRERKREREREREREEREKRERERERVYKVLELRA